MASQRKGVRILCRILFAIYILATLYFLFFSEMLGRTDTSENFRYNLTLFKEINRFWTYRETLGFWTVFLNIAGNVLVFVPFGFFVPMMVKKGTYKNLFVVCSLAFLFSLFVELAQLFLKVGAFDIDDLLLNTAGAIAGYILYFLFELVLRRRRRTKRRRKRR